MEFQPTLPARGATKQFGNIRTFVEISTHAPRTGSDGESAPASAPLRHFNPRSPHGERLAYATCLSLTPYFNPRSPHGERQCAVMRGERAEAISTHAPRTGSDHCRRENGRGSGISTHAPRTGSDQDVALLVASSDISTHAPRTGSDGTTLTTIVTSKQFQPTLPARGATPHGNQSYRATMHFNPRSPHGERRKLGFG